MKYIGNHVSAAGGVSNAAISAALLKCDTFSFFLSSPRSWKSSELSSAEISAFADNCSDNGFSLDKVMPHGNYLINLASVSPDIQGKSVELLQKEVTKCKALGITYYNLHPGSAVGSDIDSAINRLCSGLNNLHKKVTDVVIVIENMAGQGSVLGKNFSELRQIIDGVLDKNRIKICLDTCHLFAAGYDITTAEKVDAMLDEFSEIVGLEYLHAFHLNDSKHELGSKKDRHEDIGCGKIGNECFTALMKHPLLEDRIFILETPGSKEVVKKDIQTLKGIANG